MKLYIETLGCAMNVRDSEHIIAELQKKENYTLTSEISDADLILINTCSVREKPESKLFSEIGQFAKNKKKGAKIGVCGCTASALGEQILKKSPHVDFVLGARNISKITEIIHKPKTAWVGIDYDDSTYVFANSAKSSFKALLNISIGCDKKCAYCIVPFTRGREISIPLELILKEARRLVDGGTKEILLLGQNVNNYGVRFSTPHEKIDFTGLLRRLSEIDGLERIRFTSPHPLHMNDAFLDEFASNPKICKSIHIPLQSGSNAILKAMKRGYTQEWYLNRIEYLRAKVGDVGISTDIIVGFPGESDADFEETMKVLELVKFETMYSFIYSPRPNTLSYSWGSRGAVEKEVAKERLSRLQSRHKEILREISQNELGKIHKVLIENNKSSVGETFSEGRSDTNRLIRIPAFIDMGSFVNVKIDSINGSSLFGKVV
ncbi:tRNA (N6-isopentenyl adenosine(37)-C2)-methylthiotransferase MiaB [Helicobacter saguini]|uniref:tRNA-2-methylthio-N(6)-dimethylallyladenosine synthase n=1 Tax=Helicobacter saguini TaxID=1548018 RepID=A0A347VJP5_9HELI|nr:tRNA (N6-isopentenyl adenosine(37)-C2)-methylthiotransferase MiaB [Helicobacter saguini]MWV63171.1 tRNA (N6-isopentenyl adenosine(37)-C2)-methylthiotransferase MiaB [Helicobacter saguini]MWV66159.1 tRNA (N6-isopentenyl adenosine(37)-C2)-methylthiotransferase MiaB [Helicobacter saguini]MWV68508.1 tRNA (N6-isopentenyl adenosine(37)-C2)-methylthiotransferase MiaB [Helicobacter saguini]MWV71937.1 tRNA (N6-isopentenyl adenosine(37)-C2)-methylthiotransferase MiaB [Helicobacter saguini]TLD95948.1 